MLSSNTELHTYLVMVDVELENTPLSTPVSQKFDFSDSNVITVCNMNTRIITCICSHNSLTARYH